MTIEVNLRQILDRKQWEICNYPPAASAAGSYVVSSPNSEDKYQYFITSSTTAFIYDPFQDSWMNAPSPALAGTFGAGSCGARHAWGPSGTATAGSTTTLTTNLNLQRSLVGYTIRITGGPGAGDERIILSNTTGTNSVITVATPFSTTITTSSTYILLTGKIFALNGGTQAAGSFKYYDMALNTWTSLSITGLPASLGTDCRLLQVFSEATKFATGTATSATSTTLVNSAKTWTTNEWANMQVRITAGTGVGQYRTITSNTGTTLTVPTWTITPDATSVYCIEGNSDWLFLLGNNAVTMYRYSISGNSWSTVSPGVARAAAPVAGMSASWINAVTDPTWSIESNCLNGTYIYSFRGGGSAVLDRYNINTNVWENDIAWAPKNTLIATGNSTEYVSDYLYCMQATPAGNMVRFNIPQQRMEPVSQLWYAQGTAVLGDRMFNVSYTEGSVTLRWLYFITHSQATLFRMMLI